MTRPLRQIAAGYLVSGGHVLLVHHRGFGLWVPPGGHVEEGETFAEAAQREFAEETGLEVDVISVAPVIHPPDANSTPEPVPFWTDIIRAQMPEPALAQFFYVTPVDGAPVPCASYDPHELDGMGWFDGRALDGLATFDQVRSLARWAVANHPTGGVLAAACRRHTPEVCR